MTEERFTCMRGNLRIVGMQFYPDAADGSAKFPALIVSHGYTGNYSDFIRFCRKFAEAGYAAFCFSFCGGGRFDQPEETRSDGDSRNMSVLSEVEDLMAVKEFLCGRTEVLTIHVIITGSERMEVPDGSSGGWKQRRGRAGICGCIKRTRRNRMKKGNIYEGIAERLDFPNKAAVRVEGETDQAMVKGALPGQKVSFSVKKKRGGLAEGHLLNVLTQADYEYAPDAPEVCPHAATCGGCCYQTVPYEKQLEIKEDQVRQILEKAVGSGNHLESMSTDVSEVPEKSEELEAAEEPKISEELEAIEVSKISDELETIEVSETSEELEAIEVSETSGKLEAIEMSGELERNGLKSVKADTAGMAEPSESERAVQKLNLERAAEKPHDMLFEGILPSPHPTEYRNKMEFSFGDEYKDGPLALGMHRRGSFYDIVSTGDCRIVHEDFRKILRAVLDMYSSKDVTYFHKRTHQGYLRHLLVRRGVRSGEITVALVTTTRRLEECRACTESAGAESEEISSKENLKINDELSSEGMDVLEGQASKEEEVEDELTLKEKEMKVELSVKNESSVKKTGMADEPSDREDDSNFRIKERETQLIEEEDAELRSALLSLPLSGKIVGISHIYNDSVADVIQSDRTDILYGSDSFFEEILGLKFKISTFSFFQTNSLGAEVLYSKVREYAGGIEGKTIFDLYSGTGTIAQILAPVAKKVVGVEIVEEAVEAARENAALNGLTNCEFIAGDVLKVLDSLEEKPDMIVLDPPRAGIHPKALQKIIAYGVEQIVYVSCKPTSLAVDLEALQAGGYRVERACCVDMFPSTANVETIVQLSQQKPDDYVEIDLDLDELDATSAELKATYEEIKAYVWEEFGLRVSNLYISQIKRKCGLEVGECYNHPKTPDAKVPQCPPEKEAAIRSALEHFAMI